MSHEVNGLCHLHSFSAAVALCHRCGHGFCEECTVHPFGGRRPLCKDCAMVIGGVRPHAERPALPKRIIRQRARALRRLVEREDRPGLVSTLDALSWPGSTPAAAPAGPAPATGAEAVAVPAADPGAGVAPPIDWNQPFA